MVTQLEKQETKQEAKRIFTSLDTSRLNSETTVEYRKPNFSEIDFEPAQVAEETVTPSAINLEIQKDTVVVSDQIANRPQATTKVKLNARGKILISVVAICICALMAFMIGNIVTIANLNGVISAKQAVVASQQQTVNSLQSQSNGLIEAVEQNASQNGFSQIDASNIVETDGVTLLQRPAANIESNWFDKFCEFLSNIF